MQAIEQIKNDLVKKVAVHAYLVIGGTEDGIGQVVDLFAKAYNLNQFDITFANQADEIKVAEIRELLHHVNLSSERGHLMVIRNAERLNQSSGNILLKSLEEPPGNTTFLLFANRCEVLPTIMSRCRVLKINEDKKESEFEWDIDDFLRDNFGNISRQIEKIVKEDRTAVFLSCILLYVRERMIQEGDLGHCGVLDNIIQARQRIAGNGNARLILENIALRLRNLV